MARIIFEDQPKDDSVPVNSITDSGFYVVTAVSCENRVYAVGNAVVVLGGKLGLISNGQLVDGGEIRNKISDLRVRPMRAGEQLICVE